MQYSNQKPQVSQSFGTAQGIAAEWIVPVTSAPLYRHAIEIIEGKITGIRPMAPTDRYISSACLMPGLVNAHTHLAYTGLRNLFDHLSFFPWIRALTEAKYNTLAESDIEASTKLGTYECLKSGITTVADMCDLEVALRVLSESPLRGVFYQEIFGVELEQAETSWKHWIDSYSRFCDRYGRSGLRIGISPHACYTVRPELFRKVGEWAGKHQVPVSFHLAESKDEEEFIGEGRGKIHEFLAQRTTDWQILGNSSTTHLEKTGIFESKPLLAHLVQASLSDLDVISRYGLSVAHCPKSNSKFGHGIAPVQEMITRGIKIGLGTDSAASNNRLDLFEEARVALHLQRIRYGWTNLNEQNMLEWITIDAARALNMESQIGSLEVGKQADIIAVRLPSWYQSPQQLIAHLINNAVSNDVLLTCIAGKEISIDYPSDSIKQIYAKFM